MTFSPFHQVEKEFLPQSPSYNTVTVQVISKSIRVLQSYRSLNIQNIARVNFMQQLFNVLQEKLNLANVRDDMTYGPLMYTAFGLQKAKGSIEAIFAHQTIELLTFFTCFRCL